MRFRFAALPALALALGIAVLAQDATNPTPPTQANPTPPAQAPGAHPGMGRGGNRSWAGFMAGRGIIGVPTQ